MPDLDLTSPSQSRSKLIVPNQRAYMTSYPSLVISLTVSSSVTKLQGPVGQRQRCQMKPHMTSYPSSIVTLWLSWIDLEILAIENLCDNGAKWNLIYDFLSIINSNSVVMVNRLHYCIILHSSYISANNALMICYAIISIFSTRPHICMLLVSARPHLCVFLVSSTNLWICRRAGQEMWVSLDEVSVGSLIRRVLFQTVGRQLPSHCEPRPHMS